MWNPFKKSSGSDDKNKLGMLQRLAMKKVQNMSSGEREKMLQEALKPENRSKLMAAMEKMQKSGMVSEAQIKLAKEKLGL
jgi:nicotinamide mononucleotide adenylyltransferase